MLLRAGYRMKDANHLAKLIKDAEKEERREEELEEVRQGIRELLGKYGLERHWRENILGEKEEI